jgi:Ca-activated chloride channel family protein
LHRNIAEVDQKARNDLYAFYSTYDFETMPDYVIDSQDEEYDAVEENDFKNVLHNPRSTFSIDVDTASYTNVRRFLNEGSLPPPDAVRIEELINYFSYDYPQPHKEHPFSVTTELGPCPWRSEHHLLRIGLQGRVIDQDQRPSSNLVFLIDVSGSMRGAQKLPLVKEALTLLVDQLTALDRVAIVTYAGVSGLALPPTPGDQKDTILNAIDSLRPGGSTNGSAGIQLAYQVATTNFKQEGINRVILATDGDFNVGITNRSDLTQLIEEKAKTGIFLSLLGFGAGNLKDATMEELSNRGNGTYAYIDTINEARKVLSDQLQGTLITIAKDVKIQVEFNPLRVREFRLIGYENRMLSTEDFNDDTKDAGEIGAGHSITALYELSLGQAEDPAGKVNPLKYQKPATPSEAAFGDEYLTINLRYKKPDSEISQLLKVPVVQLTSTIESTSEDFKFASAVAAFGMLLRGSDFIKGFSMNDVQSLALEGLADDIFGYRREFLTLVEKAHKTRQQSKAPTTFKPLEPSNVNQQLIEGPIP